MHNGITVLAPAKINLGLRVFPRRADGFHNISSIFTTIRLFDELNVSEIQKENVCEVVCEQMELPEDNTFTKAYKAFCVLTGIKKGVRVEVTKRIPAGGGLGGGSSDSSSFIHSLNILFDAKLSSSDLIQIAGEVGSDVFFFTEALLADGGRRFSNFEVFSALVEGRGEKVSQIKERSDFTVLLVFPGVSVSTKDAYNWVDEKIAKCDCPDQIQNDLEQVYRLPVKEWTFSNDFTDVVCNKNHAVQKALLLLKQCGADFADMSGSGSTVFGVFENREKALSAQKTLDGEFKTVLS